MLLFIGQFRAPIFWHCHCIVYHTTQRREGNYLTSFSLKIETWTMQPLNIPTMNTRMHLHIIQEAINDISAFSQRVLFYIHYFEIISTHFEQVFALIAFNVMKSNEIFGHICFNKFQTYFQTLLNLFVINIVYINPLLLNLVFTNISKLKIFNFHSN